MANVDTAYLTELLNLSVAVDQTVISAWDLAQWARVVEFQGFDPFRALQVFSTKYLAWATRLNVARWPKTKEGILKAAGFYCMLVLTRGTTIVLQPVTSNPTKKTIHPGLVDTEEDKQLVRDMAGLAQSGGFDSKKKADALGADGLSLGRIAAVFPNISALLLKSRPYLRKCEGLIGQPNCLGFNGASALLASNEGSLYLGCRVHAVCFAHMIGGDKDEMNKTDKFVELTFKGQHLDKTARESILEILEVDDEVLSIRNLAAERIVDESMTVGEAYDRLRSGGFLARPPTKLDDPDHSSPVNPPGPPPPPPPHGATGGESGSDSTDGQGPSGVQDLYRGGFGGGFGGGYEGLGGMFHGSRGGGQSSTRGSSSKSRGAPSSGPKKVAQPGEKLVRSGREDRSAPESGQPRSASQKRNAPDAQAVVPDKLRKEAGEEDDEMDEGDELENLRRLFVDGDRLHFGLIKQSILGDDQGRAAAKALLTHVGIDWKSAKDWAQGKISLAQLQHLATSTIKEDNWAAVGLGTAAFTE